MDEDTEDVEKGERDQKEGGWEVEDYGNEVHFANAAQDL